MVKKVKKSGNSKNKTKKSVNSRVVGQKRITSMTKTPIRPLGDRVLVKELGDAEMYKTSASGIIIPESADKDDGGKRGKVVAVGAGKTENGHRVALTVQVGDTVIYQWGDKIKIDGEEYVIVRESEIAAILAN